MQTFNFTIVNRKTNLIDQLLEVDSTDFESAYQIAIEEFPEPEYSVI